MAIQITIPITPVTKKNHQQIMRSSKTGKPFVMPSAEYRQYEAQASGIASALRSPLEYTSRSTHRARFGVCSTCHPDVA